MVNSTIVATPHPFTCTAAAEPCLEVPLEAAPGARVVAAPPAMAVPLADGTGLEALSLVSMYASDRGLLRQLTMGLSVRFMASASGTM